MNNGISIINSDSTKDMSGTLSLNTNNKTNIVTTNSSTWRLYNKDSSEFVTVSPDGTLAINKNYENGEKPEIYENVFTFDELERVNKVSEYTNEVAGLYWNYQFILNNILNEFKIPSISMLQLIYKLTDDFIERLAEIESDYTLDDYSFDNAAFSLMKDEEGNLWWFGVPTNKFVDRQNDIISEAAHLDYVASIEKGEIDYPDLYYWHIPIKIGTTEWIDYDQRGFLVAGGKILKKYEGMVASIVKNADEPLGMSHLSRRATFVRDEGRRVITKYRSHELTFLPLSEAANELTSFTGIADVEVED